MPTLGQRLKELRISNHIKQIDISKTLGVTPRTYQRYENDSIDIPSSKLIFIANYFNVSIDYLVCRTDNPVINK